jgi:tRNA A-37 threonylcarbamoyl transferase component Bud32/tetratricopeptide (TPR) repeat protein
MPTFESDESHVDAEPSGRARRVVEYARSQAEAAEAASTPATSRPLPPNGSVPGYTIVEEVHRGGQGVVFRAMQISTKREVALKVLRNGSLNSVDRARFDREVRLLSQLRHPNVVSLQDGGVADGSCYLVMDFIEGEALDRYVERNHLPLREVVNLMVKVCDAVHAAHLRGIVHRDLKPSNIRIDIRGEPHVLDFGLAKLVGGELEDAAKLTITGQFVGSLPWAAPEQVDGHSERIDVRTDVYALGVILFVLVTGEFPYEVAGGMRTVVDSIVTVEPTSPRAIDRAIDQDLETIILKCLNKDQKRRYEGAGEIARELRRVLAGEPIVARGDSTWYVLTKTIRRHRGIAAALIVSLVLVLAYSITTTVLLSRARVAERRADEFAADARSKFRLARDGMAFVVKEVSDKLSRVGGAAQVRQSILEDAYRQLTALANERSDDPELQADLARSHYEVGDLALALGNREQANEHFEQALRIREKIAEANPDNEQAQVELSLAHVRLGDVAKAFGDRPRSEEQYQQALRIDEVLSHAHPHNLHYLDNLFWSHFRLGWAAYERNDAIGARHHLELASSITERLVSLEPRNPTRLLSKRDWSVLAGFLAAMDHDWEGAEQYRLTAVAASEKLVELEPENPLFRFRLACAYEGHAVTAAWRHDFDEAEKWHRVRHQILERLVSDDPLVEVYQVELLRSGLDLATDELNGGNPERAGAMLLESFYQVENRLW